MPAPNDSQPAARGEGLASRYEALARIAELIRSHSEEKLLFQTCASELHQVVAFDALSWLDPAANWVQWHFVEPYHSALEALAVRNIPKEETVVWWVYQNQQPVVIPFIDRETSFPLLVERFSKLGFGRSVRFPSVRRTESWEAWYLPAASMTHILPRINSSYPWLRIKSLLHWTTLVPRLDCDYSWT
jgi:hypothetical protein